jgi:hypothetical protein
VATARKLTEKVSVALRKDTLEAAKSNFDLKKLRMWERYQKLVGENSGAGAKQ